MGLTQLQATELIKRLEIEANSSPRRYEIRVVLFGLLGYAYIFAILALLTLILYSLGLAIMAGTRAGYIIGKIVLLVLGLALIILRALWVKMPHPTGIALNEKETPELFRLVSELTANMHAPHADQILLTQDFNASVVQVPRLSFIGWPKNYLLLGLPLMSALNTAHFSAILAHELGHISGQHGRFLAWIYRIRMTWSQLLIRLEKEQHAGAFVFTKFLDWYAPYFNSYSFVLARMHELDADRRAAEITSAKTAAEALIAVSLQGRMMEQNYWPAIYEQADHQPEPAVAPFVALISDRYTKASADDTAKWLREAMAVDTGYADTHPCLRDRLTAIGIDHGNFGDACGHWLGLQAVSEISAGEQLLRDKQSAYATQLDRQWRETIKPSWQGRYKEMQTSRARVAELAAQADVAPLPLELAWEQITLIEKLNGPEATLSLTQEFLGRVPDHAAARYLLGQILTDQENTEGVTILEKVMADENDFIIPICAQLHKYYKRLGDDASAQRYWNRLEERNAILALAQQERQGITRTDSLMPHSLSSEEIQRITDQFSHYFKIRRVFLARKYVSVLPEKPFYVLGVEVRRSWLGFGSKPNVLEMANSLACEIQFPGETYIYVFYQRRNWIKSSLKRIKGSEIYHPQRKSRASVKSILELTSH